MWVPLGGMIGNKLGKPATGGMWIGMFEKGSGKLVNLDHPGIRKSFQLKNLSRTALSKSFTVCVFNCRNVNLVSSFDIEESIRKSATPLLTKILCNNELASVGFFRILSETGASDAASGIPTGKRQHKPLSFTKQVALHKPLITSAMQYIKQMSTAGASGAGSTSDPPIVTISISYTPIEF